MMPADATIGIQASTLVAALSTLIVGILGWWMKKIDHKVDQNAKEFHEAMSKHQLHVAENYASKEMVEKVETKVVSVLNDFRRELREDLQKLVDKIYRE